MSIPLNILLWGFVIAFCIHIVEESTVGGGFIAEMQRNYWPEYTGTRFFWFNTGIMLLFGGGIILYELLGGTWVIVVMSWVFMFATNGLWHLIQTAVVRRYAPGLITSPIYWVLLYFILRYSWLPGQIATDHLFISAIIGTLLTLAMFSSVWYFRLTSLKRGMWGPKSSTS
jgi:hypothetical protein